MNLFCSSLLILLRLPLLIPASPVTVLHENHHERVNKGWKVVSNSLDFFRFPEDYEAKDNTQMYCQRAGDVLTVPVNCDEPRNPDSSLPAVIDRRRPTVVLLHGYMGHRKKPWIESMSQRIHQFFNANVCVVDWSTLAELELELAVLKIRDVGQRVAMCLRSLVDPREEKQLARVALIGYGLGAHLAGCVGKNFNGQLGRIFGLDPLIEFTKELLSNEYRLSSSDARFVQVAHTSIGSFGAYRPSGHQDFYFNNGGRSPQPGCNILQTSNGCSHFKAVEFMFHSLNKSHLFLDTMGTERFGFYTYGTKGSFLVKTGSKPPYVN